MPFKKLELYGLYKQATKGDNNRTRPGALNLVALKKWLVHCQACIFILVFVVSLMLSGLLHDCELRIHREAWYSLEGTSMEEAKKTYIEKVNFYTGLAVSKVTQ